MGTIQFIKGDVFDQLVNGYAVVHQCNCTSVSVAGLAHEVFKRYPDADNRGGDRKPLLFGTTNVYVHPGTGDTIINVFSQLNTGIADGKKETAVDRVTALWNGLSEAASRGHTKLVLPARIGCHLGGGDWGQYKLILELWARVHKNVDVLVCDING
jgi:hypothetical protein